MAKLLTIRKDGGPLSKVWGFFILELKTFLSIVLLRFGNGSREAYHSHAFNAWSWVLKGQLRERTLQGEVVVYRPSWRPIYTPRERCHKVVSVGNTWVISFRGPWAGTWVEYLEATNTFQLLTWGRDVVETFKAPPGMVHAF